MQFEIPDWLKWSFETIPGLRGMYRSIIFWTNEINYPAFKQGSFVQKIGTFLKHKYNQIYFLNMCAMYFIGSALGKFYLNHQLGHKPELLEKVTPNYEFGCKRITPSNEYYPALSLDHVEVIRSPITQVKENSIVTEDGTENKIDVI